MCVCVCVCARARAFGFSVGLVWDTYSPREVMELNARRAGPASALAQPHLVFVYPLGLV